MPDLQEQLQNAAAADAAEVKALMLVHKESVSSRKQLQVL